MGLSFRQRQYRKDGTGEAMRCTAFNNWLHKKHWDKITPLFHVSEFSTYRFLIFYIFMRMVEDRVARRVLMAEASVWRYIVGQG